MTDPLLQLDEVRVYFPLNKGIVLPRQVGVMKAVDGVSLDVARGEVLGLVGESGCGKTTLARAILQTAPLTGGTIRFEGRDLAAMPRSALRRLRPQFQMISQDPYASLNPRMTVFDAIAEPIRVHGMAKGKAVAARVSALMEQVGLAARFMKKYPHEFSGGQRQRIAIARTLALEPRLIVADEPVSALDVSVQAQILNLIGDLCKSHDLTLILISHDLAVVRHLAHRIAVMYLGRIVEMNDAEALFTRPQHPYTQVLLGAIPMPDPDYEHGRNRRLLLGEPPSPLHPPSGCPFHPRCPAAGPDCAVQTPELPGKGFHSGAACLKIRDKNGP